MTDRTLGHFRLLAELGRGGMGQVWEAEDQELGRRVALKILPDEIAGDPDALRRFRREARAIAALDHPGIVTVHSVHEEGGVHFFVMELVRGRTLAQLLDGGPLPVDEAVRVALDLARALAVAHDAGIVHRDLKPGNVMVTDKGTVKVLDFGLARAESGDAEGDEQLTRAGTMLGTVPYMSPEQLRGETADARSDLYSLGVVFFELLTGERPFGGRASGPLIASILRDSAPSPSTRRSGVPAELDRVVLRCLEKERQRRFSTAHDLIAELEELTRASDKERSLPSSPASGASAQTEQEIRFCATADGVRLAWANAGAGPTLVRALGWFTHLEEEWESSDAPSLWLRLARALRVVRYDGRGIGLSATGSPRDASPEHHTLEARVRDLAAVIDAAGAERFALMGISEGGAAAIRYTVDHPDRVSHLILLGSFSSGRPPEEGMKQWHAMMELMRTGWGADNPAFRQLFSNLFLGPDAAPELVRFFNEMQRISARPEVAVQHMESNLELDVRELLPQVGVPTLVIHCRGDQVVPFEAGRRLAANIPGARFLPFDGDAHYLTQTEETTEAVAQAIERFVLEGDEPSS